MDNITNMKRLRITGSIVVLMDVPVCITIEEIEAKFKEHAQNGTYLLKNIRVGKVQNDLS